MSSPRRKRRIAIAACVAAAYAVGTIVAAAHHDVRVP